MWFFDFSNKPEPKFIFVIEWGYFVLLKPGQIYIFGCFYLKTSSSCPIKLTFPSAVYRRSNFPCTSTNPAGSTHRVQQNWAVAGFKEDCVGERFCDIWQSRRGKLHVFCTFRAAWPHQRNSNVPWWVTPNYCSTSSGKPQSGKYLWLLFFLRWIYLQYMWKPSHFPAEIFLLFLRLKAIRSCSNVSEIRVDT